MNNTAMITKRCACGRIIHVPVKSNGKKHCCYICHNDTMNAINAINETTQQHVDLKTRPEQTLKER